MVGAWYFLLVKGDGVHSFFEGRPLDINVGDRVLPVEGGPLDILG